MATSSPTGELVHPDRPTLGYAAPGGPAVTVLPIQEFSSPTWLPIVATRPGWAQVLLPTRPTGASAWIDLSDMHLHRAHTPYVIHVDRARFLLTLTRDARPIRTWTIGDGKPSSPTPAGATFVLAAVRELHPTYSPLILPLGIHSLTYSRYGGGPGTIGIHTWPTTSVYGHRSSDGCVRVPPDALALLGSQVPIGTPVLIT